VKKSSSRISSNQSSNLHLKLSINQSTNLSTLQPYLQLSSSPTLQNVQPHSHPLHHHRPRLPNLHLHQLLSGQHPHPHHHRRQRRRRDNHRHHRRPAHRRLRDREQRACWTHREHWCWGEGEVGDGCLGCCAAGGGCGDGVYVNTLS
jgi:hypothetical protein